MTKIFLLLFFIISSLNVNAQFLINEEMQMEFGNAVAKEFLGSHQNICWNRRNWMFKLEGNKCKMDGGELKRALEAGCQFKVKAKYLQKSAKEIKQLMLEKKGTGQIWDSSKDFGKEETLKKEVMEKLLEEFWESGLEITDLELIGKIGACKMLKNGGFGQQIEESAFSPEGRVDFLIALLKGFWGSTNTQCFKERRKVGEFVKKNSPTGECKIEIDVGHLEKIGCTFKLLVKDVKKAQRDLEKLAKKLGMGTIWDGNMVGKEGRAISEKLVEKAIGEMGGKWTDLSGKIGNILPACRQSAKVMVKGKLENVVVEMNVDAVEMDNGINAKNIPQNGEKEINVGQNKDQEYIPVFRAQSELAKTINEIKKEGNGNKNQKIVGNEHRSQSPIEMPSLETGKSTITVVGMQGETMSTYKQKYGMKILNVDISVWANEIRYSGNFMNKTYENGFIGNCPVKILNAEEGKFVVKWRKCQMNLEGKFVLIVVKYISPFYGEKMGLIKLWEREQCSEKLAKEIFKMNLEMEMDVNKNLISRKEQMKGKTVY